MTISSVFSLLHMRNLLTTLILVISAGISSVAVAHEFWLEPGKFILQDRASTPLTINVGEHFVGERIPFTVPYVASLWRHSTVGRENLLGKVARGGEVPSFELSLPTPGTHLIAFDSHPNQVTLSGDKFHAYLHEEGLDAIGKAREAAGTAGQPGRERYRRHVKTLLRAGAASDRTFAVRTGQRLEIVPQNDPLALHPGGTLMLNLYFDEKPLSGALVKAWHKRQDQTLIIRTHSDKNGALGFDLPYPGRWMISVVHMIEAKGVPDVEWDSFWGNLTFELPAPLQ